MYPIFKPLLNKGGAGRSLSRADTVDALNPIIARLGELIALYDAALYQLSDRKVAAQVEAPMNRMRNELGKLRETVLANGGVPPSGVGARSAPLGDSDGKILRALDEAERAYRGALRDALAYPHHQIRTMAILENNVMGSDERLGVLRPLADRAPRDRRPAPATPENEATGAPADIEKTEHHAGADEQPMTHRPKALEGNV